MNNVEILAPAGSTQSLQASFKAGADAVYLGGAAFGARAYAKNPDNDELLRAIDYAHMRNKKLYLTVNTLVKERELDALYKYLEMVYKQGLDAAIVQDLGVMKLIAENFPDLPIHLSTQSGVTDGAGVKYYLGNVTRVVPARELTLEEIARLKKDTGLEIEVFTHGALCYSYSGNCLFSSMCGDRSGNRGRCAQPCRLKTGLTLGSGETISGKYLLSPKDLSTIDFIPELVKAGVDSFKIEGRMKAPEYSAYMAWAYKKALDIYLERGEEGFYKYQADNKNDWELLKSGMSDLYNRGGFTSGYAFTKPGPDMMSVDKPNHQGTKVGQAEINKGFARIKLEKDLNKGDVIMLDYNGKDKLFDYTTPVEYKIGDVLSFRAVPKEKEARLGSFSACATRIRNNSLIDWLNDEFIQSEDKKPAGLSLKARPGEELVLTASCQVLLGDDLVTITSTTYGPEVSPAKNQPATVADISEKLSRSGESVFEISDCQVELEGDCFIPKSQLGAIRREALASLEEKIYRAFRREKLETVNPDYEDGGKVNNDLTSKDSSNSPSSSAETNSLAIKDSIFSATKLKVSVYTIDQLKSALSAGAKNIILDLDSDQLIGLTKDELGAIIGTSQSPALSETKLFVKSRRITDETNIRLQKDFLDRNASAISGAYIKNLAIRVLFANYTDNLIADKWLYVTNSYASSQLKEADFKACVLSQELTINELEEIKSVLPTELMVYGREELMISKQCLKKTLGRCNKRPEFLAMTNELAGDSSFTCYQSCSQCRNIIFDGQCIDLISQLARVNELAPSSLILSLTKESGKEAQEVVTNYLRALTDKSYREGLEAKGFFGHFYKQVM